MPRLLVLLVLVLFRTVHDQEAPTIVKRVFEGLSGNVDLLCNIGRQHQPQYWRIQERIYDLDSIPEFFLVQEHGGLRIPRVDRRLNGWRFQCFAIDFNTTEGMNPGQIIELNVFYGKSRQLSHGVLFSDSFLSDGLLINCPLCSFTDSNVESPATDETDITKPFLYKRPVLNYQEITVDSDYVNFTWKYYNETSHFEVSLYTQDVIDNAESQRDLSPEIILTGKSISSTYDQSYFRISELGNNNLESASTFYSLFHIITSANSRYCLLTMHLQLIY